MIAGISIEKVPRRSPGDRILVYLDQSAISALALQKEMEPVRESLRCTVRDGHALCVRSGEHRDETMLAPPGSREAIDVLSDELAIGVEFKAFEEIEWQEIHAAAAAFSGASVPPADYWREAFGVDPQISHDELFIDVVGTSMRLRFQSTPAQWQIVEVEHEKSKENPELQAAYAADRAAADGSFDKLAERYLQATILWRLGYLLDRAWFAEQYLRLEDELAETADPRDPDISPGSPFSRLQALAGLAAQARWLSERFPSLSELAGDFARSSALRHMPSLVYPALLRAAIAVQPGRRAKSGDGYDIKHLTQGLSRCDIVTADGGMTQICRERGLVPTACCLLSFRELARLPDAIDAARAARS